MITPHLWIASVAAHPSPTPACATRCNKTNIRPGLAADVGLCPLWLQKRTKQQSHRDVRLVPKADSCSAAKGRLIRSPRRRGRAASVARQGPAPLYDALSGWAGTEK